MSSRLRTWGPAIAIFILGIAAWEGLVRGLGVERFLLPPLSDIVRTFWDDRETFVDAGIFTFKEALSTREGARRALKSKLDLPNGLPPAPIDELALELLGLGGEAVRQPGLFVARARQLAEIAEAARQLRARYGRVPLYHAIEVEPWSRIPERRWALVTCDV